MTSTQKAAFCAGTFIVTAMIVLPPSVWSDTVQGLNSFMSGETALASDVNQNFSAIGSAVNGNDSLIAALEARIEDLEGLEGVPGPQGETGLQGAPGAPGPGAANFELVGFTTATFTGGEGVLGYTAACGAEFPDSRMCTSIEIMNTVNVPTGLTGNAWVRPVLVPGGGGGAATEASGIEANSPNDFSCSAWRGSGNGLVVYADGDFSIGGCTGARLAACCGEVP
jgi:hypothetical protein